MTAATGGTQLAAATGTPERSSPAGGIAESVITLDLNAQVSAEGVYHLAATSALTDQASVPVAYGDVRIAITRDASAPVAESTAFVGTRAILVDFDDALAGGASLGPDNFAVSVTDGVITSGVELAGVSYNADTSAVTLTLAGDAVAGWSYTIVPSVSNAAFVPYSGPALSATYTPLFEATTASTTAVDMAFTFTGTATVAASDIRVDGVVASGVSVGGALPSSSVDISGAQTVRAHIDGPLATDATPRIVYAGEAADWTDVAADGLGPEILHARFVDADTLDSRL